MPPLSLKEIVIMERYIIPLLKSLVLMTNEATSKKTVVGVVMLPDNRKVVMRVNKEHKVASLFIDSVDELMDMEALSPELSIHIGQESKKLLGISVIHIGKFIFDWQYAGGVRSILPALRRFAGRY